MLHHCKYCNYQTNRSCNLKLHIKTKKHETNKLLFLEKNNKTKQEILNIKEDITKLEKTQQTQNKTILKQDKNIKTMKTEITEVKHIATKAKVYSKSCLAFLNEHFKDNPSLKYPGDEYCKKKLYEHFKINENNESSDLEERILYKFNNNKLIDSLIQILLPILKKDDVKQQSIFNTDTARSNFAAKYDDEWKPDKAGIYLNSTIIKPFCNIIIDLMTKYLACYKNYVKMNKSRCEKMFDECDKITNITKCLLDIGDSKLYDAIIYRLSSNLHYKMLIKNLETANNDNNDNDNNDNDNNEDKKVKITKPTKKTNQ
jgi:hypothetical protein